MSDLSDGAQDGRFDNRTIDIKHLPPFFQATTAAIGSVLSNALVYPLDLVTTRMQTRKLRSKPPYNRARSSSISRLSRTSSISSYVTNNTNFTTNTLIYRKKKKNYRTIVSSIKTILQENESLKDGFKAFYNGLIVDCSANFINSFIYFYVYTTFSKLISHYHHHRQNKISDSRKNNLGSRLASKSKRKNDLISDLEVTIEELVVGSLAGMVSKFFTCPLSNITVRLQATGSNSSKNDNFNSQSRNLTPFPDSVKGSTPLASYTPFQNERISMVGGSKEDERREGYFNRMFFKKMIDKNENYNSPLSDHNSLSSSDSGDEESSSDESQGSNEDEYYLIGKSSEFLRSILKTVRSIRKERGYRGFWSGYSKSLILTLNPSLTLYLTKVLERRLKDRGNTNRGRSSQLVQVFLNSAISSALSTILTYPLMLSKTLIQFNRRSNNTKTQNPNININRNSSRPSGDEKNNRNDSNETNSLRRRVKVYGLRSIYVGLEPKLLKVFIGQGVTMTVKNQLERIIIYLYLIQRRNRVRERI